MLYFCKFRNHELNNGRKNMQTSLLSNLQLVGLSLQGNIRLQY
jgi:hypothetical protein